mmetsp:Transcript_5722/g.9088  ORF Transcript_5722/g.9088 Transcript_5722/m.9088 type:complete len:254 (-) Transcript_5722:620-1381(-)
MALNSTNFLILGLPFMKSEPKHFTCKDRESGEWRSCSKQEICAEGLSKDEYQPDESDSQYIENWQEQAPMLCESKPRIGFIGACFFIGILVASTIIPVGYISDKVGRKWVFVATIGVLIIACLGFMTATTLEQLYVSMFLLGLSFPGTLIVGINYALELQIKQWRKVVLPMNNFVQGLSLISTAFYFQFVSKRIYYLELANVLFLVYLLIQVTTLFPESPKFRYSREEFSQAKECLQEIADINGVKEFNKDHF